MEDQELEQTLKLVPESAEDASMVSVTPLDETEPPEIAAIEAEVEHMGKFDPTKTLKTNAPTKIDVKDANFWYGSKQALKEVTLPLLEGQVTALIGPSGCGKSTFLRTLNRMNDLVPGSRVEGQA